MTLDLSAFTLIREKARLLPYGYVKEKRVVALEKRQESLVVATLNKKDFDLLHELRVITGCEIEFLQVDSAALDSAIALCYRAELPVAQQEKKGALQSASGEIEEDLLGESDSQVVRLLSFILTRASELSASDIHFEPQEGGLVIRYRVDGELLFGMKPQAEYGEAILTRLKVMARLDLAEKRLPQDGRMKLCFGEKKIDCRVSTLPVVHGERVVLRILDRQSVASGLDVLGIPDKILADFRHALGHSQGMILVTGPTGSGKTTTLYAALSELASPEVNLMTIEDPVEYKIEGIAQIHVNSKIDFTFASGLRHILRQDPDVVMVGEVRDNETAQIAMQASMTGHLVLTTLHTNDAPSAITRLIDMGVEPFLITSSVIGVMAQRLVRRLCPHCRIFKPLTHEQKELLSLYAQVSDTQMIAETAGCEKCAHSGYLGRMGLYEWMKLSLPIKRQILTSPDATFLKALSASEGMSSLSDAALCALFRGETSLREAMRMMRGQEVSLGAF